MIDVNKQVQSVKADMSKQVRGAGHTLWNNANLSRGIWGNEKKKKKYC